MAMGENEKRARESGCSEEVIEFAKSVDNALKNAKRVCDEHTQNVNAALKKYQSRIKKELS